MVAIDFCVVVFIIIIIILISSLYYLNEVVKNIEVLMFDVS